MTTPIASPVAARPFFLACAPAERFCVFHPAAPGQAARGALLYIHPFAEELNKSRRMAALQARALAGAGFHVLQIDLYGCGDSSGDFADARWPLWKRDVAQALNWLSARVAGPYTLWGLRLGALLALDLASDAPLHLHQLILWQPILNGRNCIDQFLRLEVAGRMLAVGGADRPSGAGARSVTTRQQLAAGTSVEVGGYLLTPELVRDIDEIEAAALPAQTAVSWFEISPRGQLSAAASGLAERWRAAGVSLSLHGIAGPAFWNSGEIATCPDLLTQTTLAAAGAALIDQPPETMANSTAQNAISAEPA